MLYLQHDDGAGQAKTVETALIGETDRAIILRRGERKTEQSHVGDKHNGRVTLRLVSTSHTPTGQPLSKT